MTTPSEKFFPENSPLAPRLVEFKAWPKIGRLSKSLMVVTEKIDGTNAAVGIMEVRPEMEGHRDLDHPAVTLVMEYTNEDGVPYDVPYKTWMVYAQSRKRLISVGDDNYGFAKWVRENADTLVTDLGPGLHFGEWWGFGIQRGYGLAVKKFSLFNTLRWGGQEWPGFETPNMSVVPQLRRHTFDAQVARDELDYLRITGSRAVDGYMNPEGIVIHVPDVNGRWKMTFDGDEHKSVALREAALWSR